LRVTNSVPARSTWREKLKGFNVAKLKVSDVDAHPLKTVDAMGTTPLHVNANDEPPRLTLLADPGGRVNSLDTQFREIYERWFEDVVKWLYALGVPSADTEDLAQEIFMVVRRSLARFDGGNVPGWLYRISELTVRDHRRRAWFKNLTVRRQDLDLADLPHASEGPAKAYEHAENRRLFQSLIAQMSEKRRTTFVLFEVEGYSGEEIAQIQDIPLGTVWTRLHHARKDFWKLVKELHHREAKGKK
jgi:RNA polymerase sigma-70 factor (ECF subfamily)